MWEWIDFCFGRPSTTTFADISSFREQSTNLVRLWKQEDKSLNTHLNLMVMFPSMIFRKEKMVQKTSKELQSNIQELSNWSAKAHFRPSIGTINAQIDGDPAKYSAASSKLYIHTSSAFTELGQTFEYTFPMLCIPNYAKGCSSILSELYSVAYWTRHWTTSMNMIDLRDIWARLYNNLLVKFSVATIASSRSPEISAAAGRVEKVKKYFL